MGQHNLLISQIRIETRNCTFRVTDNEIVATVFAEHIPFLIPALSLFKVYDITNAQVKFVPPRFRIINNQYHWILQRDTLIRPVLHESPYLRYFSNKLTPFSSIARNSVADPNDIGT
ncbi:hypothetical protein LIER_41298 [Lithospermum erythrorhizon]|uniref:Uncharacterized protein n=1 Tax=Lithospermum erythrorhizon TaxID=34254 RepID=A0AAV3R8C2_LITER